MNMKKIGFALSLTAAFGLMACGDSSSNSNGGMPSCNVTSDANSVTRSMSYGGESVVVKQTIEGNYLITTTTYKGMPKDAVEEECEEAKYDREAEVTCEGNSVTTKVEAEGMSIAKLKTLAESTCKEISSGVYVDDEDEEEDYPSKKDGRDKDDVTPGVVDNDDPVYEGSNGGNSDPIENPIDPDPDPITTTEDIMGSYGQPCTIEGEKKNDVVFGMNVPMICKDGFWDADEETMEALQACNVEGATKDTVIAGIAMTLTCDEGEWTMDEASAEEMLKCDQEGAKAIVMGLPVICKDGQWDLDEDAMDWGDYLGDWDDEGVIID